MKKGILFLTVWCICLLPYTVYAQLNVEHNGLRAGDIIIKQQIQSKSPGEAGANQFWDFSETELINDEYELVYSEAPVQGDSLYVMGYNRFEVNKVPETTELLVGTEHQTMYYYKQTPDSLLLLGHENVAGKLQYLQPLVNLKFPMLYGEETHAAYQAKGIYSGSLQIASEGTIQQYIDAFGTLILPAGDTISPVIRVKSVQYLLDTTKDLLKEKANDQGQEITTYRWYTKGYRYPIFEIVECKEVATDEQLFATAFHYPLQNHFYLETDPDNQALLDELWEYTEKNTSKDSEALAEARTLHQRVYPNPVEDILHVEYELEADTPVSIVLSTVNGRVVKTINQGKQQAGIHSEQIYCSHLPVGIYLLKISTNDLVVNEKVMKK